MITVQSYLKYPDDVFVPVAEASTPPPDQRYVDGAIELDIDGVTVLDKAMWDLVDQLWGYITDMIITLDSENEARTYFPDQPIELRFEKIGGDRILVSRESSRGRTRVPADRAEFVDTMLGSAEQFFTRMADLTPDNDEIYRSYLDKIREHRS